MNFLSLGKLLIQNYFFMQNQTRNLGYPIHLDNKAYDNFLDTLTQDKLMQQKFALVVDIKNQKIIWHLHIEKFIPYKGLFETDKFFKRIHPDFLLDFLKWVQATYVFVTQNKDIIKPLNQSSRLTLPLKLIDNKYYWILQEVIPLQVDAANNLVTHLNIYTIVRPMEDGEKVKLVGRLYNDGFEVKEWTQMVWKTYFTSKFFEFTTAQRQILDILQINIELSNTEIAIALNKLKNTIDVQNKLILARAKEAFPNQPFKNVKELVKFLGDIGYFNEERYA
jgi:hypothetical protein